MSEAYLTALIPSYKKRICHYCLEDHQKRLTVCCSESPGPQLVAAVHPACCCTPYMQQSLQSSYCCVMMQDSAIRLGTAHLNANTHTGQVGPRPFQKAIPRSLLLLQVPPPPLLLLAIFLLRLHLLQSVLTQGMWCHTA